MKPRKWYGLVLPALLIAMAEVAMAGAATHGDASAAPSAIALAIWDALRSGQLTDLVAHTLSTALAGLLLGGGLGVVLGIWFGLSIPAARLAAVSIELLRPIPSIALVPIAMLVFGFGFRMETSIIAFTCFWPMLLLSTAAIKNVEPRLLEVAQLMRMNPVERTLKIILPAALPRVFVASRLSAGIALTVAVTVEIAANPFGLGYGMLSAQQSLQPDLMWGLLIVLGTLGWGLNKSLLIVQYRAFGRMAIQGTT